MSAKLAKQLTETMYNRHEFNKDIEPNGFERVFLKVVSLEELPKTREMLRQLGFKFKVIYQGPRPAKDHNSGNPSFTLKKNANRARVYILKQQYKTTQAAQMRWQEQMRIAQERGY